MWQYQREATKDYAAMKAEHRTWTRKTRSQVKTGQRGKSGENMIEELRTDLPHSHVTLPRLPLMLIYNARNRSVYPARSFIIFPHFNHQQPAIGKLTYFDECYQDTLTFFSLDTEQYCVQYIDSLQPCHSKPPPPSTASAASCSSYNTRCADIYTTLS